MLNISKLHYLRFDSFNYGKQVYDKIAIVESLRREMN